MSITPRISRRAFTLIEVVAIVIILALAVPPSLMFMDQSTSRRADAINAMRATTLATLVMESILADVASTNASLGYAALASSSTYLDTPTTGLKARISTLQSTYADMGMSYSVTIGSEVNAAGIVSATLSDNVFRQITVTVTYPSASEDSASLSLVAMVSDL